MFSIFDGIREPHHDATTTSEAVRPNSAQTEFFLERLSAHRPFRAGPDLEK